MKAYELNNQKIIKKLIVQLLQLTFDPISSKTIYQQLFLCKTSCICNLTQNQSAKQKQQTDTETIKIGYKTKTYMYFIFSNSLPNLIIQTPAKEISTKTKAKNIYIYEQEESTNPAHKTSPTERGEIIQVQFDKVKTRIKPEFFFFSQKTESKNIRSTKPHF